MSVAQSNAEQTHIHPTAIVHPAARVGSGASVGAYCVVGEHVTLGDGVNLISHVVVEGRTRIGNDSTIYPFSSVGHRPQDLKYHGEPSELIIGERCTIRENCTLNPGTAGGGMRTEVGDDCLFMASTHVAHDCKVGDHVIMANFSGLAGHVAVEDYVILGAGCIVHQHVRLGEHAFIGAQSMIDADVIPFGMAIGNRAELAGLNLVGLKRRGFSRDAIHALRAAYRMIFSSEGTLKERTGDAEELFPGNSHVQQIVDFLNLSSGRAVCMPRNGHTSEG
ncbi:MAG: acyl-ACP--UDP-N-acetylglucosamine O-acyltransferase [Hyphomicrobiaceae bacterium]|nr:acyl-ACP--UDP-N-acetylglucosamine O-acyltransferase [Hyphomicrobiaceae bacterium]MCC0023481.1 acyl-ACP--UDP-N-acetylglucosamine O-acyltransferase [Hyphomicrobiaceae bacterium]